VSAQYGIPVLAIANLDDLFECLSVSANTPEIIKYKTAVAAYRQRYGV
jgi:orotate phosphoribosyltransferase